MVFIRGMSVSYLFGFPEKAELRCTGISWAKFPFSVHPQVKQPGEGCQDILSKGSVRGTWRTYTSGWRPRYPHRMGCLFPVFACNLFSSATHRVNDSNERLDHQTRGGIPYLKANLGKLFKSTQTQSVLRIPIRSTHGMQYPFFRTFLWPAVVPTAPGRTHALNDELSEGTDWKCTRQKSGAISKIFILNSESILNYLNPLLRYACFALQLARNLLSQGNIVHLYACS